MSTSIGPQSSPSATANQPRSRSPAEHAVRNPTRWRAELGRWLAVGDAGVIALSSLAAYLLRAELGRSTSLAAFPDEVPTALGVVPLWLLLFYFAGAYRSEYLNTGGDAFRRFAAGVSMGVLAVGFISFMFRLQLARLFVLFLAGFVFLGGGLLRLGVRRYLRRRHRRGELLQRTVIIGADEDARRLASVLHGGTESNYRVIGFLDRRRGREAFIDGLPVLGHPEEVVEVCAVEGVGCVIVSPAGLSPGTLKRVLVTLEGTEIDLAVAPSLEQVVTQRMTIETVGHVPILHVDQVRLRRGKAAIKRALDLIVASFLLIVTLPLMALAGCAIAMTSAGGVLFRQERSGRDGRPFTVLKFRTMVPEAEVLRPELEDLGEGSGDLFKIRDDPRITRVGRHIRRWSIDELPQLINVLRGDMSMVGPRPLPTRDVDLDDAWHRRRLRVRPGLTGLWQVSGRSAMSLDDAVRADLFYIENWSLGQDLYLLGRTVGAVLSRRGAW